MSCRFVLTLFLLGALGNGCAMVESSRVAMKESMKSVTFSPNGYRDSTAEEEDEWDIVGKEGRGHMAPENDPDPWWQKYVMSAKARSIERNLGIQ